MIFVLVGAMRAISDNNNKTRRYDTYNLALAALTIVTLDEFTLILVLHLLKSKHSRGFLVNDSAETSFAFEKCQTFVSL